MTVLDNAVLIGKESTYGTAVALTRGFEAKADTFKRVQEPIESVGFRAGMHAQRSDRSRQVNKGGTGAIEVDVLDAGFGLIFQTLLGSSSGPTQIGATDAYRSTFATTPAGPPSSWTIQVLRANAAGTVVPFTHTGCVVTQWSLKQEVDGNFVATFTFDFQNVVTNIAAGTPVYVEGFPYNWTEAAVSWNGTPVDFKTFELTGELGFDVDRRFLRGNELKKQPVRSSVPTFSGTSEMEFESLTHYNAWVAGTVAPIVVTWTGEEIESGEFHEVELTISAAQFSGESPEVALDSMPKQALPFRGLHNASSPAVSLTYTSTDTAL